MLEPSPYAALRAQRGEPQQQPRIGIRQLIQQMRQRPTQVVPTPQPPLQQPVRSVLLRKDAPLELQ